MEKSPENFPVDECGVIADRILSRILADLTAMREIVVRAASASMRDEARADAQRDIENLKDDITRLTGMLSRFSVDAMGMTAEEYAENMALIDRSIEEAAEIVGKSRTEDETLSKWFDRIVVKGEAGEDEE